MLTTIIMDFFYFLLGSAKGVLGVFVKASLNTATNKQSDEVQDSTLCLNLETGITCSLSVLVL